MNDRIRELALQAGGEFWQRLENDVVNPKAYITFDPPETLEKFVELIVDEMYDFMCKATDNDDAWPTSKEVKDHFGVKDAPVDNVDRILRTIRTRK
jgi:hypothetical protein